MHQRAALRFEELAVRHPPGAMFGDLACSAGHHILVALAAPLCVIRRPEAIGDGFGLLEDEPVVVERSQSDDVVFIDRVECRPLRTEAVGFVVEASRRLAWCKRRAERRRSRLQLCFPIERPDSGEPLPTRLVGRLTVDHGPRSGGEDDDPDSRRKSCASTPCSLSHDSPHCPVRLVVFSRRRMSAGRTGLAGCCALLIVLVVPIVESVGRVEPYE